jgi:esterase/lipase superfamily enzyme
MYSLSQMTCTVLPYKLISVAVLLSTGCQRGLMPTPNICADSSRDPFREVPKAFQSSQVQILYATDRVPIQDKKRGLQYGVDRSKTLAFGTCTVELGKGLSWENLVEESRTARRSQSLPVSLGQINERGRYPEGMLYHLVDGKLVRNEELLERQEQADELLRTTISEYLATSPRKEAYVFVHGVGDTFERAAGTIAGLWHFMGRVGVPVLYSWPAGYKSGIVRSYTHDRESGEFTNTHLKRFLRVLASCPDLQKIHLISHSRGTAILTTALSELHNEFTAAGKQTRSELKLGHLVLMAADMDFEVVALRVGPEGLYLVPDELTVYASEKDLAMKAADWLFGSERRLGQLQASDLTLDQQRVLSEMLQLQFIDAKVASGFVGHSYFYKNPAVSSDLILLLRDHRAPGADNGRPLIKRPDGFWELREGYPAKAP